MPSLNEEQNIIIKNIKQLQITEKIKDRIKEKTPNKRKLEKKS